MTRRIIWLVINKITGQPYSSYESQSKALDLINALNLAVHGAPGFKYVLEEIPFYEEEK